MECKLCTDNQLKDQERIKFQVWNYESTKSTTRKLQNKNANTNTRMETTANKKAVLSKGEL